MNAGLKLELPQRSFLPGEPVEGKVHWSLARQWDIAPRSPTDILVRVGWYTDDEGQSDLHVYQKRKWAQPSQRGNDAFEFELPAMPCSYNGTLIRIKWCITAETQDGLDFIHEDIVVGPNWQAIAVDS